MECKERKRKKRKRNRRKKKEKKEKTTILTTTIALLYIHFRRKDDFCNVFKIQKWVYYLKIEEQ